MNGPDDFVDVCREFIDLVNLHVGAYVDACAGFAGNKARVERQVAKIMREQRSKPNAKDGTVVVFASFDDPGSPDSIHHRIVAARDFIENNSEAGSHAQMHAQSAVVFLFSKWDEVIRPKLAIAKNLRPNEITLDIMGDLRLIRHAILHNDGYLTETAHSKLKVVAAVVPFGKLNLSNDVMHAIFAQVKTGTAELLCNHLGLPNPKSGPEAIKEIAIQRVPRSYHFNGR
jgi:hypothetical protein